MHLYWWVDRPASGSQNMRIDRRLFDRVERGTEEAIFLRLYAWSPPAVSLGFHQDASPVDEGALARDGVDWVRRPTGGAAVLHDDEITYAVVAPLGLPGLGRGVLEIHDALAAVFVAALAEHGVGAALGGEGRPEGFACFGAAGGHEITVRGRKLVGSALRRGRRAFLQHGSLLRGRGHLRLREYLGAGRRAADPLADPLWLARRTICLEELGRADLRAEDLGRSLALLLAARTGAGAPEFLASSPV